MSDRLNDTSQTVTVSTHNIDFNDGSWVTSIRPPATASANTIVRLPATAGSAGNVLSTDGSGTTSWATLNSLPNSFVSTGSNLGAGIGVFKQVATNNAEFKSLTSNSYLTWTASATEVLATVNVGSTAGTVTTGNDSRLSSFNILYVKKNPGAGEYLTVTAALAAITTNAAANPFLIKIGAGIFVEAPLTLKPYVFLDTHGWCPTSPIWWHRIHCSAGWRMYNRVIQQYNFRSATC